MSNSENGRKSVLVVGGGIAGIQASLDLANMGFRVYLVEKTPSIGGRMSQLDKTFPTNDCSMCILAPKMIEASQHPNIKLLTYSELEKVSGEAGNFKVKVKKKATYVDWDKCTGCGECSQTQLTDVKESEGETWVDRIRINEASCIQCGDCTQACVDENKEKHALTNVAFERRKFTELPPEERAGREPETLAQRIALMDEKSRMDFWQRELSKCIKCFGCRDVCPVWIYDGAELEDAAWIKPGEIPPAVPLFQIIRAYRVADLCINCGMCEEACPMDIPLRAIHQLMRRQPPESVFEIIPGLDAETKKKLVQAVRKQPKAKKKKPAAKREGRK
jgi:heterodisulfide reductase subunit A-like polyferredoxin